MTNVISLGNERTNRSGTASDWKPEECVAFALEALKVGGEYEKAFLAVTVIIFPDEDGSPNVAYYSSSPDAIVAVGALEMAKNMVMNPE